MKRILFATILLISGTILFSACSKQSSSYAPDTFAPVASVDLSLTTLQSGRNSLINWQTGYITTTAATFSASYMVGNAVRKTDAGMNLFKQVPLLNTQDLGTVTIAGGNYLGSQGSAMLNSNEQSHAMFMGGLFVNGGSIMPVSFILDTRYLFASAWLQNVMLTAGTSYKANMVFDPAQILTGITANDFANATPTNGQVVISAGSNVNMYNTIVNNMTNGIGLQLTVLPVNASGTVPNAAAPSPSVMGTPNPGH